MACVSSWPNSENFLYLYVVSYLWHGILNCNIVLAHDIIIRQHMVNYSNVRFIYLDPLKQHTAQKKNYSNKKIKDVKDGVCVYLVL